jgi:hypothetical protein
MVRAFMIPIKPQKSNKGFNYYFQVPEFIMKIFIYLHTPLVNTPKPTVFRTVDRLS